MTYKAFSRFLEGEITMDELHTSVDDTFNNTVDSVYAPIIDHGLVGTLKYVDRFTAVGCVLITDRYLTLDATGRFSKRENSAGSTMHVATQDQNTEYGHWTAKDNLLVLQLDNGESIEHQYTKYDCSVMLSGYIYQRI